MLGIIQHSQNRNAEAAASLEKVVAAREDPSVRYSLGILYAYYLEQPDKGLEQLQRRSITRIPLRISRRRWPRKSRKSRNTKTTRLSRRSNVHKNKKAGAPPKGSSGLFVYEGNTG